MSKKLIIEIPDEWVVDVDMIDEDKLRDFLDDEGALEGDFELGDEINIEGSFDEGPNGQVHRIVKIDEDTIGLLSDDTYAIFPVNIIVDDMDCIKGSEIREMLGNAFTFERY